MRYTPPKNPMPAASNHFIEFMEKDLIAPTRHAEPSKNKIQTHGLPH